MQGIVDGFAAPEGTRVAAHDPAFLPAFQPVSVGPNIHRSSNRAGIDRVSVVIKANEASFGHRGRNSVESIKRANIGHKARALFFEHFPDCFVSHLRMGVGPAICQATIFQPGVQLSVGFKLWSRHKESSPEYAHLVLDLTLLPT